MWFNGRSEQRILAWREFRQQLNSWPADIQTVVDVWSKAPTTNYLTQDNPHEWPEAWQLVSDNLYCDIGIALGMFYTLYYSSYPQKDTMRLRGYKLRSSHKEVNLVLCEGEKYVLNYEYGRVVNTLRFSSGDELTYDYPAEYMMRKRRKHP